MLEIKMTSGDVLVHGDQQPDAMTIKGYDGSKVLIHAGEWGRHKYIRKEGNRYIYPEDLQKVAQRGYEAVQKGKKIASTANDFIKTQAETAKYATKDALRKGSEAASKTAETTKQKAKNIYDDRKIYADAAKNMAYDNFVNGTKLGKLYKRAKGVSDAVKSEASANRSQVTAGNKKKFDSVERSMPTGGETKKRPKSRQKKVVDGGMDVKIKDKRTTLRQIEKDKEFVKNSPKERAKLPVGAKESDQIISAHQGSTGKNRKFSEGAKSLNEQKEKTLLRKIEKADRPKQAARQAEQERKNKRQEIRNEVGVSPNSINQIKIDTLRRKEHGAQYAKEKRAADQAELERRRRALGWY